MAYLQQKKRKASKRSFFFIAILTLAALLSGFQFNSHNAVTGYSELAFISQDEEIEIGEEMFEYLIQESGGRYEADPELSAYVTKIGQKLAKLSDRPNLPYEFVIVNDDTLNAWALPGGKIAINKGLLLLLDNEAELSAILAHEITHAAARHAAQRWERFTFKPGTDALQSFFNPTYGVMVATDMITNVVEFKYSRDSEYEADKYGMEYMARAGYDITAAKTAHEKLLHSFEAEGIKKTIVDTLLSSHPDDMDRICNIENLSQFYPAEGIVAEAEYKEMIAKLSAERV